jgi:hypothetical protein
VPDGAPEKRLNHEGHEDHEEKQILALDLFFVSFVSFVVQSLALGLFASNTDR